MPTVNIDEATAKKDALTQHNVANPKSLPFNFFYKPSNKTTKLLANAPAQAQVEGRNRWYEYKFTEYAFVTYILVNSDDYGEYDKFSFEWETVDGKVNSAEHKFAEKSSFVWINDAVISVRFRPPSKWLSAPNINRVTIAGVPRSEVKQFLESASAIEKLRNDAVAICEKAIENAATKNSEISDLETKINNTNIELNKILSKKTDSNRELSSLSQKNTDASTKLLALEDSLKNSNDRLVRIE